MFRGQQVKWVDVVEVVVALLDVVAQGPDRTAEDEVLDGEQR